MLTQDQFPYQEHMFIGYLVIPEVDVFESSGSFEQNEHLFQAGSVAADIIPLQIDTANGDIHL